MVGGIIERVVHLGPGGQRIDPEDGPIFPNTIKLIARDGMDRCAVHVAPCNYNIEAGDKCWWQSGKVYWTKPKSKLYDVPLVKVGYSYSGESIDLPEEATK